MAEFSAGITQAPDVERAALELAESAESVLGGGSSVAGALVLATAAAGLQGAEVGRQLALRWPAAELIGTSFEGVLAGGRVWRDEPAIGLLAWTDGPEGEGAPVPLVFEPDEQDADEIAHTLLEAAGRERLGPEDLLLLFPDAMESLGLAALLAALVPALGSPAVAGAAASGIDGGAALGWAGHPVRPGALLGLLVPGLPSESGADRSVPHPHPRVSRSGASREASPWLEITGCRTRWIDELDGEPPLDWIRRQLGLEARRAVEPFLDRLLVRVRRGGQAGRAGDGDDGYDEQYVVGVDPARGSISLPGRFERGDEVALALPDADLARTELRASVDRLAASPMILQFACRARDEALHGDRDLESALVAHHAGDRSTLGTVAPFQLGPDAAGRCCLLVHATVLAALGDNGSI